MKTPPQTLFEKLWASHLVRETDDGESLLYVDRHLVYEVTSPQAFEGLRLAQRRPWRADTVLAVADHNVPTLNQHLPIKEELSRLQVEALKKNCAEHQVELYGLGHPFQGIVHVIGPELGVTQPGMTIVCGDSHTSTHGALGGLAFGIGASEVAHVLETQTIWQARPRQMRISVIGRLPDGVTAKDLAIHIICRHGAEFASGFAVEYAGSAVRALSIEGRMTLCNMSIEFGSRFGVIAPDDKLFEWLKARALGPRD